MEALREGDLVQTLQRFSRLRWIGRRHLDLRRHPRPWDAYPVRSPPARSVRACRTPTCWSAPDHAIFVAGRLVPARHLLNGITVVRQPVDEIAYFHVELAGHAVLLANGLPAESYLDTGNRGDFADAGHVATIGSLRERLCSVAQGLE